MERVLAALKTLAPWQVVTLAVVLFGATVATYGAYDWLGRPEGTGLGENQQLIPVHLGNVVNQVSTSGNLTFPNRVSLIFGSEGAVEVVLVEEGHDVKKGQVIARLDAATLASLERAVAQARVDLQDAEESLVGLLHPSDAQLAEARERAAQAAFQLQAAVEALAGARKPYTEQDFETQEVAVADARLALQEAQKAVLNLAPEHAQQLAQAQSDKAQAELSLEQARDNLNRWPADYARDLAQARQEKADAELALRQAEEAIEGFAPDYAQQLVQARKVKADAESALRQAQDALAELSPGYDRQVGEARKAQADAEMALQQAQVALDNFAPDYNRQLAQARKDKADAELASKQARDTLDSYEAANSRWLETARETKTRYAALLRESQDELAALVLASQTGSTGLLLSIKAVETVVEIRRLDLEQAQRPLAQVEQLEAAVGLAQDTLDRAVEELSELEQGPDPLRRQQLEAAVEVAQLEVDAAMETLAQLGPGPDALERHRLEAAVELAQAELARAERDLAKLETGLDSLRLQQLEAAVDLARAQLTIAEKALADTGLDSATAGGAGRPATGLAPGPLELALREGQVALALAVLLAAEEELADLEAGPDPLEAALRDTRVALARATLAQAEEDLSELRQGPDPMEVALKQKQVDTARASLALAEEDLAGLLAAPDPLEAALQEALVASARLNLQEAVKRWEGADLKAPIDGLVALVNVEDGDEVGPSTVIAEMVDPTVVEIDGVVDQIDVLMVQPGARATVTMDALPGRTLEGTVSRIASAATNQQGVVTYPVRIQVEVPQGLQLREGLSVTASIVLQEERNVLVVPEQALYGAFDQPVVRVMTSAGVKEQPVVLGSSDGFWVAVQAGLAEGDRVVMETAQVSSGSSPGFRTFTQSSGIPGGGFGGGPR